MVRLGNTTTLYHIPSEFGHSVSTGSVEIRAIATRLHSQRRPVVRRTNHAQKTTTNFITLRRRVHSASVAGSCSSCTDKMDPALTWCQTRYCTALTDPACAMMVPLRSRRGLYGLSAFNTGRAHYARALHTSFGSRREHS